MAFSTGFLALTCSLLLHCVFMRLAYGKADEIVAVGVYIFGDSLVDVGNNDYLPLSLVKADFPFNGVDFHHRQSTGRFSNGKNAADFIAEKLGLPSPPPHLSLRSTNFSDSFLAGLNFASGGAGILNNTSSFGKAIDLTTQVDDFNKVYQHLIKRIGSFAAKQHLSKSLFVALIGSNDLLHYSNSPNLREKWTPQQYVDLMLLNLKQQIQKLYTNGARKWVIPGVGMVGCAPAPRLKSEKEECNADLNSWSLIYNEGIKSMLSQLESNLQDFTFSYSDTYGILRHIMKNPGAYGFNEVKGACCGLGKLKAEVPCLPISELCKNRSTHLFWDFYHPTQETARVLVNYVYDAPPQFSFPVNMKQLLRKA